jgi:hypothetical protein
MRLGRVPEFGDAIAAAKQALNGGALHALAAAVNQADDLEAGVLRGFQIIFDDGYNVLRLKRVEIDCVFNRDVNDVFIGHVRP